MRYLPGLLAGVQPAHCAMILRISNDQLFNGVEAQVKRCDGTPNRSRATGYSY